MAATAAASPSGSSDARLVVAALVGIALIVLLITKVKLHPFLSLTLGALTVGAVAGVHLDATLDSFGKGVGSTVASVGTLIALGAILGRLLADSGGADQIVDTIVGRASARALPWAMALVGALIGLPMFFEIGLVLLIPVIVLVSRRANLPLMRVGIPALAGLSVMHGLVPPHPGPLVAVAALKADLGLTLGLGVLIAIPTVIVAGPLFSRYAARWVPVAAPDLFISREELSHTGARVSDGPGAAAAETLAPTTRRPSFGATLFTVLLPVVLMLGKALVDIFLEKTDPTRVVFDFLGTPLVALLIAVLVAMVTLGRGAGLGLGELARSVELSFPPIAGILLIVAAGGGFKQVLVDSGVGQIIAHAVNGNSASPLLLAWVVAVLIRLATGSATVATITASGILAPVAAGLTPSHTSLLVLAIGSGSLFLSHVNDAGFWLVKEYFGVSVGENLKTWSVMETLISVMGIVLVLVLGLVI